MPGVPLQDLWTDIPPIQAHSDERLGYPTQKPEALLERIIKASSNEGELVLEPDVRMWDRYRGLSAYGSQVGRH